MAKKKTEEDYGYVRTNIRWKAPYYEKLKKEAFRIGMDDVIEYVKFIVAQHVKPGN